MRVTATEAKNRFGSLCARGDPSMVRYDVFPNPSASARNGIPYVVVIQSELLDALSTRLTVPLATLAFAGKAPTALCPTITEGRAPERPGPLRRAPALQGTAPWRQQWTWCCRACRGRDAGSP